MQQQKIMAFIDYENLRQSISKNFLEKVNAGQIARTIRALAEELGEFRGGAFFGDWSRRPIDAREIEENGFRAENVLMTRSGKDRSDVPMALEMDDVIRQREDIDTLILGSGDSGFAEVIRRAIEHGKHIYVCAIGLSAARELFSLSERVFPLETRLGLTPKTAAMPLILPLEEWRLFVLRLNSLEKKLPYVVRNYLRDTILDPSLGCGETMDEKDAFLNKALDEGIMLQDEMPNPKLPGKVIAACHLNRENDIVKQILPKIRGDKT